MANPYRSTVTIDGTKFDAVSSQVVFTTAKDRSGMPEMGSLRTRIRVCGRFPRRSEPPVFRGSEVFRFGERGDAGQDQGHQNRVLEGRFAPGRAVHV